MKKMTNVIAVFGYNNSRIYDVEKIKNMALEKFGAEILLIKEHVDKQDLSVTRFCFDAQPERSDLEGPLRVYLKSENLNLIGCLPFSDKGVIGAAHTAKAFGLFGDDDRTAKAMLDKHLFRELEAKIPMDPSVYRKPFFKKIHDADELLAFFERTGTFFIKPASEGNSRGCMKISSRNDLLLWLEENAPYLKNGVICEEYLSSGNEFSCDGVNGSYWVTEKYTTEGAYRAEYQHIVPAPLDEALELTMQNTLRPLLTNLGSRGGAFHHEFFNLTDSRLASVEPNRRPAGMWIWDLAAWSFENFNPWATWLEVCAGKKPTASALKRVFFSGVRGVISSIDGTIAHIDEIAIRDQFTEIFGSENFRFSILKQVNSIVRRDARDNADFLAYVALRHKDALTLKNNLALANEIVLKNIEVCP